MKSVTKIFINSLIIAGFSFTSAVQAQSGSDSTGMGNNEMKMEHKMKGCDMMSMQSDKSQSKDKMQMKEPKDKTSIVREGTIDLKSIDKNKDGKVFQDMMDWNVISDIPGKCPLCKMTLKEVSLKEAKDNLLKHGFKVKG